MSLPVTVHTQGYSYQGWESVTIQRSLEQTSNTFSLKVSNDKAASLKTHPIKRGTRVVISIGTTPVINGYVGKRNPSFSENSHTIGISGRDITCDIVDSSAIIPNQELHKVNIKQGADILCAPLNIPVDCPNPGKNFDKFVVNDGETIHQCIENHAKQRGLLIYTEGDGILHIRKPKPIKINKTLEEGVNIKKGSATHDDENQFNKIISKSQKAGSHRNQAIAINPNIREGRVLILRAEKANGKTSNQNRAEYEMKLRKAKGERCKLTVQGWEWAKGKIWQPNQLVNLKCPNLDITGERLLSSVTYSVDDKGGTIAVLDFVHPDVFL